MHWRLDVMQALDRLTLMKECMFFVLVAAAMASPLQVPQSDTRSSDQGVRAFGAPDFPEQFLGPMHKRFNFNFLRTWQPLPNGDVLPVRRYHTQQPGESSPSAEIVLAPEEVKRRSEQRRIIQNRLLCMAALANPMACNEI
ncbi:hypothetical protein DdX_10683 [Ditylenchus destructor]|uniref:Uncharacterized protein n=1 Tax=Ditylenchus destructor TaxID=166010 RepID=A0AAD4MXT5_9BILA|nr:hypothetical protein DdX_10683 [Ditylenchus destructor]